MSQSRNPFRPDYVDPWWFKIADFIPDWLAILCWMFIFGLFAFVIGGQLHEMFCGCK